MRPATAWSASRMDAREQLRRYLEQRKETGEHELVLDRLSVDEAMSLLGAAAPPASTHPPNAQAAAEVIPPSTEGPTHTSADWRDVLRAAGAAPEAGTERRERREVAASEEGSGKREAGAALPRGLSVGDDDRQLFGGTFAEFDSLHTLAGAI